MTTISENIKNTIISEIEESLLGGKTTSTLRSKLNQVNILFFFS